MAYKNINSVRIAQWTKYSKYFVKKFIIVYKKFYFVNVKLVLNETCKILKVLKFHNKLKNDRTLLKFLSR